MAKQNMGWDGINPHWFGFMLMLAAHLLVTP
jgi:hypothetical protein